MNTYQSITQDIINLGIKPYDKIAVHSSMKKIGETEGGGDTVLDALCDYLGAEGLLMLPCHTWGNIEEYGNIFHQDMPSNLGLLPNLFRVRNGVHRSLHPTHSVCAFGQNAEEFVQGELGSRSYCSPKSCYKKLMDMGGKILLMGVTLTKNTFFHGIEEWITDNHDWFEETPKLFRVRLENGDLVDNPVYFTKMDTSEYFDKAMDLVLGEASTKVGKIGNADCILMDCQKIYPIIKKKLLENPRFFMTE